MARPEVIQRRFSEPDRRGLNWEQIWQAPDRGLINCWEIGRILAEKEPELAARCKKGVLPPLNWKGGVARQLKKKDKFGSLKYLAQWQGLRGEDLRIDLAAELTMTCSVTGMMITFTADPAKLADQQTELDEDGSNG